MTDVNILAELYMQLGSFAETHALIMRAKQAVKQLQQEVCWVGRNGSQGWDLLLSITCTNVKQEGSGSLYGNFSLHLSWCTKVSCLHVVTACPPNLLFEPF